MSATSLLVSFLSSNCTPILLHGSDATRTDKRELKSLSNSYNRAFMKNFGLFDNTVISQCQWYSYCLDLHHFVGLVVILLFFSTTISLMK